MAEPMLRIENVWKAHGRSQVLRGVSLDVARGTVLCLLGPSGAGKSTLLRCVNALESPDRGLIRLDGMLIGAELHEGTYRRMRESALSRQRAEIGMVFQNFNLFPHMSVLDNIADAPLRVRREKRAVVLERARTLLARFGLADKAAAYPRQLSGGQQQRVAIARALAMEPRLMLFDEPTSALDPHLVGEVRAVIQDLARTGMTMMIVTHEVAFARDVAEEVAIMIDGSIVERGPPGHVLRDPRDARTRNFLARTLPEPV
jgi:polar amino acid transport system ATP-binding protein